MYKVTIRNLGRDKKTVTAMTKEEPDYAFMCGLARQGLVSSVIEFAIRDDEPALMTGKVVVGGFRSVGDFVIEKGLPDEVVQ